LIQVEVPGRRTFQCEHLVLDLNGTVALDGRVIPGVDERVAELSAHLVVHLVTADTRGKGEETSARMGCHLVRVRPGHEARQKRALVERLGAEQVTAIGNGLNDAQMLSVAALGIAVLGQEGLAHETLQAADLLVGRITDALELLLYPQRLVATLRR
jgi:P-type E1-E2 ATPase